MGKSSIPYCDRTWEITSGCSPMSEGCRFCFAKRLAPRLGVDFSKITLYPERLEEPLHWRKPQRVFVCSRADLFHKDVPVEFILSMLAVMAATQSQTYLILTKRADHMACVMSEHFGANMLEQAADKLAAEQGWCYAWDGKWPLPNLHLGVSVESPDYLWRVDQLIQTPAAIRWISFEPLLTDMGKLNLTGISWCVVAGESGGPPERALVFPQAETVRGEPRIHWWEPKLEALKWVRSLRDQCQTAGIPWYFKGWGGPRSTSGGDLLDGKQWHELPEYRH